MDILLNIKSINPPFDLNLSQLSIYDLEIYKNKIFTIHLLFNNNNKVFFDYIFLFID